MEAFARAPEPLKYTKPMDKTWKTWKQGFVIFLKVAGYDKDDSEKKAMFLLHTMGSIAHESMQNMQFDSEEDKQDYDILIQKFDDYFDPPKSETEERFKFYTRDKKNNESIEAYIADLKEKAKTCNFGDLTDSLIRDMVILHIKDKHLRQIMFDTRDMNMDKLIMNYKQFELNTEKMKEVSKKTNEDTKNTNVAASAVSTAPKVCSKCGTSHLPKNCPAYKAECEKCKEKGHFTQRCPKPKNVNNANVNTNPNANKNKNFNKSPFNQTEKTKK